MCAVLGVFALVVLICLFQTPGHGEGVPRVLSDMRSIHGALLQYNADYNAFPQGTTDEILAILTGRDINRMNPRNLVFFNWSKPSGRLEDPWNTLYEINFTDSDSIRIRSAGQNKRFGDDDDFVYPRP